MATNFLVFISVFSCVGSLKLNRNLNSTEFSSELNEGAQGLEALGTQGKCNYFHGKRVMLVNVNTEYLRHGMFYNWYTYAKPYLEESNVQLVIDMPGNQHNQLLTISELSDDVVIMNGKQQFMTIRQLREAKEGVSLWKAPFGSKGFRDMMTHRVSMLTSLVKANCEVLQADIDTAWLANPFKDIDAAGNHDLILTYDHTRRDLLCGCFMFFRPSILQKDDDFFETWMRQTRKQGGNEQKALNTMLHGKHSVDYGTLPREYYRPGNAMKGENAHVVHANWVVGWGAKVGKLKGHGAWHPNTVEWLKSSKTKRAFEDVGAQEESEE